jgi:3-isopropylmalate/(R)-2-methylmalate dehydratase large subunit
MPKTLFDKIWDAHEVQRGLIYIDLHLVHEVTSPQAFDGLRLAGRRVRRTDRTLATADHNVPTDGTPVAARIRDELSRKQVETLERNCEEFGIPCIRWVPTGRGSSTSSGRSWASPSQG